MKLILAAFILITTGFAHAAVALETCVFDSGDKQGAIVIRKEGRTESGGGALNSEAVLQTKDVKRFTAKSRSEVSRLYLDTKALEVLTAIEIDVPWKQIQSVSVTALNNNKNRENYSGAMVITLFDAKKNILLRVGQLGLKAGICQ